MNRFVILLKRRHFDAPEPIREILGEARAIQEAERMYREGTLQMVALLSKEMKVVYKVERRCHCTNVQQELSTLSDIPRYRCADCRLWIDHEAWNQEGD